MVFVIGLLTVLLVLDCLFLILLVLMQLPKKEAGAGLAFGGAATDALFGAGSGNFLTKATKYTAIGFFVLAVFLGILQNRYAHGGRNSELKKLLERPAAAAPADTESAAAPGTALPGTSTSTNLGILPLTPSTDSTNSAQ